MSRGLGRAERAILEYLTSDWRRRYLEHEARLDVVASVTGLHRESLRRAMKTLEAKGMLTLGWDNGYRVYQDKGRWVADRFWETSAPTMRLSADYLSALNGQEGTDD